MEMANLIWRDYLVFISFIGSIAGLILLYSLKQNQTEEFDSTERLLLLMSFTYWLVYCVAFGLQKFNLPDWEVLRLSLQVTTVFSYFLTFCCTLILPLYRFASQYAEE